MIGWIILGLMFAVAMFAGIYANARWGRGSRTGMSPEMEAEAANYVNYGRGPFVS